MIADRLGHEKVSTTLNTYSHMFPHKQKELVDKLQNLGETAIPTPPTPTGLFPKEKAPGKVIQMPIRNII